MQRASSRAFTARNKWIARKRARNDGKDETVPQPGDPAIKPFHLNDFCFNDFVKASTRVVVVVIVVVVDIGKPARSRVQRKKTASGTSITPPGVPAYPREAINECHLSISLLFRRSFAKISFARGGRNFRTTLPGAPMSHDIMRARVRSARAEFNYFSSVLFKEVPVG